MEKFLKAVGDDDASGEGGKGWKRTLLNTPVVRLARLRKSFLLQTRDVHGRGTRMGAP